jgi:hypothetical protein
MRMAQSPLSTTATTRTNAAIDAYSATTASGSQIKSRSERPAGRSRVPSPSLAGDMRRAVETEYAALGQAVLLEVDVREGTLLCGVDGLHKTWR